MSTDTVASIALQLVLAVSTTALAIYTGRLYHATSSVALKTHELSERTHDVSERTAELARDTVAATLLSDRHHQESLTPILLFVGKIVQQPAGAATWYNFVVDGRIINRGLGPAVKCEVNIGFGESFHVGPVGANSDVPIKFEVPGQSHEDPNGRPFHMIIKGTNLFTAVSTTEVFGAFNRDANTHLFTPPSVVARQITNGAVSP